MEPENERASSRAVNGRVALVEAAKRLLPDRAPTTIAGRDLATEAGVNYGLVHHHFGGKDAALTAGLLALRDDFVAAHGDAATLPLLTESDPYLRALVRWNADFPESASVDGGFPISAGLVAAVAERMHAPGDDDAHIEAKARAIAMTSIQLCVAVFGPVLLDATGVRHRERHAVQAALASLYDSLALIERKP
jgi:AcrR family transcriptional regulator